MDDSLLLWIKEWHKKMTGKIRESAIAIRAAVSPTALAMTAYDKICFYYCNRDSTP